MLPSKQTTTAKYILSMWGNRYRVKLPDTETSKDYNLLLQIADHASPQGKANTAERSGRRLEVHSEYSGILANQLLSYIDNVVDLSEARQLARALKGVYIELLELYQEDTLPDSLDLYQFSNQQVLHEMIATLLQRPSLDHLESELEPSLAIFRKALNDSSDSRMIGFLTTLFHFANKSLLESLTIAEQTLLIPYMRFVEEHVCIPWQRICNAATSHQPDSPILLLVAKIMPISRQISVESYQQLTRLYISHQSRRGRLTHDGVKQSVIRDFEMGQAYLHLCLLENSVDAIVEKLLPLCLIVFPCINVNWQVVEESFPILLNSICQHLDSAETEVLLPMYNRVQALFTINNPVVSQHLKDFRFSQAR